VQPVFKVFRVRLVQQVYKVYQEEIQQHIHIHLKPQMLTQVLVILE